MSTLSRIYDRVLFGLFVLAGAYLAVIMGGVVFNASARTMGLSGSSHIFTFTEYGLLYITMFGAPWLVRVRGHVYVELITAALPLGPRAWWSRGVSLICVAICLVLAWYAGEAAVKNFLRDERDMRSLDMPVWLLTGSMPICFGLMAAEFLRFTFGRETMHTGQAGVHE